MGNLDQSFARELERAEEGLIAEAEENEQQISRRPQGSPWAGAGCC
jgi:hypothetical protein